MQEDRLSKHIKAELFSLNTPLDTNEIWGNIAPDIAVKKDNNNKSILLTSLLLISCFSIWGLALYSTASIETKNSATVTIDKFDTTEDNSLGNVPLTTNESKASKSNGNADNFEYKTKVQKQAAVPKNVANLTKVPKESTALQSASSTKDEIAKNRNIERESYPISRTSMPLATKSTNSNQVGQQGPIQNANALSTSFKVEDLDAKNQLLAEKRRDFDAPKFSMTKRQIECYDPNKRKGGLAIQIYGGADMVYNKYSIVDTMYQYYLDGRQNTEKYLELVKGGVLFKYNFNDDFYIKAGVEYNELRERFKYEITNESQILLEDQIIEVELNMMGDTIDIIRGDVIATQIETKQWDVLNKYKAIDIPIILGYNVINNDKWRLAIDAGIHYNINFTFEGMLLNEDISPVHGDSGYFINRTGLSGLIGMELSYEIANNIDIFGNFKSRHVLRNINSDTNPINQKFTLFGTAIGLEYTF